MGRKSIDKRIYLFLYRAGADIFSFCTREALLIALLIDGGWLLALYILFCGEWEIDSERRENQRSIAKESCAVQCFSFILIFSTKYFPINPHHLFSFFSLNELFEKWIFCQVFLLQVLFNNFNYNNLKNCKIHTSKYPKVHKKISLLSFPLLPLPTSTNHHLCHQPTLSGTYVGTGHLFFFSFLSFSSSSPSLSSTTFFLFLSLPTFPSLTVWNGCNDQIWPTWPKQPNCVEGSKGGG